MRDLLYGTGRETFDAVKMLKAAAPQRLQPANGAVYPRGRFGESLRQIAQLIRADVGLEVAFADMSGWDTHAAQGNERGQLALRLKEFGDGLAAFDRDLGERMRDVVVLTMSEFGRTVRENGNRGTDHGHGTAMFVLGGAARGGKVHGRWPGLSREQLHEGRDLAVTTDFRSLFAEVAVRHLGAPADPLFPGFKNSGVSGRDGVSAVTRHTYDALRLLRATPVTGTTRAPRCLMMHAHTSLIGVGVVVLAAGHALGQSPAGFEVASVKRSPDAPFGFPGLMLQPGGRATSPGTSVRQLILVAYGLQDLQLVGGPSWIATDLYAIDARAGDGATRASVRLMLRSLLAERFQLIAHLEKRELPALRSCSPDRDGRAGTAAAAVGTGVRAGEGAGGRAAASAAASGAGSGGFIRGAAAGSARPDMRIRLVSGLDVGAADHHGALRQTAHAVRRGGPSWTRRDSTASSTWTSRSCPISPWC